MHAGCPCYTQAVTHFKLAKHSMTNTQSNAANRFVGSKAIEGNGMHLYGPAESSQALQQWLESHLPYSIQSAACTWIPDVARYAALSGIQKWRCQRLPKEILSATSQVDQREHRDLQAATQSLHGPELGVWSLCTVLALLLYHSILHPLLPP